MKKKKLKAAIIILVSRSKILKITLDLFYKNWNNNYNYPVYIHTFGKVFTDKEKFFFKKKYKNIFFEEIKKKIPNHIPKRSLFHYRFYNNYAYKSFSPRRIDFLHMCNFASNISSYGKVGCLSAKLKKYDFIMRIDDDSWFKKKINYDFFQKLKFFPMATGRLTITKGKYISLTREKLYNFIKSYVNKYKIKVINKKLRFILNSADEHKLNLLPYSLGNLDLYNIRILKKKKFQRYIKEVNKFGGIYKYRWADYDLINLFTYLYFENPIYDFKLKKNFYETSHYLAKRIDTKLVELSIKDKIGLFIYYLEKRLSKLCSKFRID